MFMCGWATSNVVRNKRQAALFQTIIAEPEVLDALNSLQLTNEHQSVYYVLPKFEECCTACKNKIFEEHFQSERKKVKPLKNL